MTVIRQAGKSCRGGGEVPLGKASNSGGSSPLDCEHAAGARLSPVEESRPQDQREACGSGELASQRKVQLFMCRRTPCGAGPSSVDNRIRGIPLIRQHHADQQVLRGCYNRRAAGLAEEQGHPACRMHTKTCVACQIRTYSDAGPRTICTNPSGRIHFANAARTCPAVIPKYIFAARSGSSSGRPI